MLTSACGRQLSSLLRSPFLLGSIKSGSKRTMSSSSEPVVLFKEINRTGLITLNRPKALNSLDLPMIRLITPKLIEWQSRDDQSRPRLVVVEGAGSKAYCAGGDVRAITDGKKGDLSTQCTFFREEYTLVNMTQRCKETLGPYVALIDGIVMGGGVGMSVHGDFRVATEKTLFAMPETRIGLAPDVGGSYFLPRLAKDAENADYANFNVGMFLALSGYRLKASDCRHIGLATHMCLSSDIEELKESLVNLENPNHQTVAKVLDEFSRKFQLAEFSLKNELDLINQCFSQPSLEQVVEELKKNSNSEFATKLYTSMVEEMSPTALKVTFREMHEGVKLPTLAACLEMEFGLVRACSMNDDFFEGVRALLVDKDNNPKWNPDKLDKVTDALVDEYFKEPPANEALKLK